MAQEQEMQGQPRASGTRPLLPRPTSSCAWPLGSQIDTVSPCCATFQACPLWVQEGEERANALLLGAPILGLRGPLSLAHFFPGLIVRILM